MFELRPSHEKAAVLCSDSAKTHILCNFPYFLWFLFVVFFAVRGSVRCDYECVWRLMNCLSRTVRVADESTGDFLILDSKYAARWRMRCNAVKIWVTHKLRPHDATLHTTLTLCIYSFLHQIELYAEFRSGIPHQTTIFMLNWFCFVFDAHIVNHSRAGRTTIKRKLLRSLRCASKSSFILSHTQFHHAYKLFNVHC